MSKTAYISDMVTYICMYSTCISTPVNMYVKYVPILVSCVLFQIFRRLVILDLQGKLRTASTIRAVEE